MFHQPQGIQDLQIQDGLTRFHGAERAEHLNLGLTHRFGESFELRADIYEKRYEDLRPRYENVLDVHEFGGESNFDRIRIEPETARARGLELTLRQRPMEGLDWWINYTWSKVEDEISGLQVRRSWDQRHALTGNLTWEGARWSASAVARYHSGWPRTPLLVGPILDDAGFIVGIDTDISQRNTQDFDDYFRVDVRVSRTVPMDRGEFKFFVEVFNVLNAENQCCVEKHQLSIGPGVSASPSITSYFPFFPSFGFSWTFAG